jgi:hypothetical protein
MYRERKPPTLVESQRRVVIYASISILRVIAVAEKRTRGWAIAKKRVSPRQGGLVLQS